MGISSSLSQVRAKPNGCSSPLSVSLPARASATVGDVTLTDDMAKCFMAGPTVVRERVDHHRPLPHTHPPPSNRCRRDTTMKFRSLSPSLPPWSCPSVEPPPFIREFNKRTNTHTSKPTHKYHSLCVLCVCTISCCCWVVTPFSSSSSVSCSSRVLNILLLFCGGME